MPHERPHDYNPAPPRPRAARLRQSEPLPSPEGGPHGPLLLTLKDAAARLGYGRERFRSLVKAGQIRTVSPFAGHPRVTEDELRRFVADLERRQYR